MLNCFEGRSFGTPEALPRALKVGRTMWKEAKVQARIKENAMLEPGTEAWKARRLRREKAKERREGVAA